MIVVNLFAGPGAGKSTTAAGVFHNLKTSGVNCEYVHEWIKWSVWEDRLSILDDQMYIFAKQHHMLHTLRDKVDVAVTDSPILFSLIYGKLYGKSAFKRYPEFFTLVENVFKDFDNENFIIDRVKPYNQSGRVQSYEEACKLDLRIARTLTTTGHKYTRVKGDASGVDAVTESIIKRLGEK